MDISTLVAYFIVGVLFAEASQRISRKKMPELMTDETGNWLIYTIVILTWPLLFLIGTLLVIIEELKK